MKKKQQARSMTEAIALAAYADGVRQGKARERARLRRIWNSQGMQSMTDDLSGGRKVRRR